MFPEKFNVISKVCINMNLKSKRYAKHSTSLTFLLFDKEIKIKIKLEVGLPMYLIDKFK